MKKEYKYPRHKIIFPYIFLLSIPFISIPLYLQIADISLIDENLGMKLFNLVFLLSICGIAIGTLFWMINKLKTRIMIDERGIAYKSMFKNLFIKWDQISSVERKYLFERRYPRQDLPSNMSPVEAEIKDLFNIPYPQYSDPPNDLIVKTKKNNTIRILHILKNSDGDDISELENEITNYGSISIDKIERDKISNKDKKEWRKLFFASIIMFAIGVILSLIKLYLVSLAFIFFGIWLFLFFAIEHMSRFLK